MGKKGSSSSQSDRPAGADIGAPPLVVGIGERANRVAGYFCSRKGAWPKLPAELAAWV